MGAARLGRMAGTIRGVKATTVLWANSKNVRIHSMAVDWTSSSTNARLAPPDDFRAVPAHQGRLNAG